MHDALADMGIGAALAMGNFSQGLAREMFIAPDDALNQFLQFGYTRAMLL